MRIRPFEPSDLQYFNVPAFPLDTRAWVLEQKLPIGFVAYSPVIGIDTMVDLYGYVASPHRRQGLGSTLLNHALNELQSTTFQSVSSPIEHPRSPEAQFLDHHQFYVEHVEIELVCQLDQIPIELLAEQAELHMLETDAAAEKLRIMYDDSFSDLAWYQPYADAGEVLDDLGARGEVWFLHDDANAAIGFIGVRREQRVADIEPLGIIRAAQGKGFGRKLLASALQRLKDEGYQEAQLAVWENNTAAIRLYQQFGFQRKHRRVFMGLDVPRQSNGHPPPKIAA